MFTEVVFEDFLLFSSFFFLSKQLSLSLSDFCLSFPSLFPSFLSSLLLAAPSMAATAAAAPGGAIPSHGSSVHERAELELAQQQQQVALLRRQLEREQKAAAAIAAQLTSLQGLRSLIPCLFPRSPLSLRPTLSHIIPLPFPLVPSAPGCPLLCPFYLSVLAAGRSRL